MHGANALKHDFMDLRTRAEFLDICGDHEAAARMRELSLQIAREVDLTCYAYQLMWRDLVDQAIELLDLNAAANPDSWNIYDSLGEAFELKGDLVSATENYRRAATLVTDGEHRQRIEYTLERLAGLERAVS